MMMDDRMKILLVDDIKANLLSISNLLECEESDIFTAGSGNEALSLMLDNDFAVVLLDVMMPEMNGFEVAEIMKSHERTRMIPIIFITAMDDDEDFLFKGYESGAIDFLFKPVNPVVLKSKVNVFCELHRQKESLNASIAEKEFLIKEIHHRVKNNLIMINSFINLQRTPARSSEELELLSEVENRISSIALIHEKLYSGDNYRDVNIREYLTVISDNLLENINSNQQIELEVHIDDIRFPIDPAISLGFLLTEMMTNTIKYAFPDERDGKISISFDYHKPMSQYQFVYRDNGIGITDDALERRGSSLGLMLIKGISEQLKGELRVNTKQGIKYDLIFPG